MDSQFTPSPQGSMLSRLTSSTCAHILKLITIVSFIPKPISDEKNVWFFWHAGHMHMHPYTQRNIRAWHRRFSKHGRTIRVLDRLPSSLNVANFLDISDPGTFPRTFVDGTISGGDYVSQRTSDLVQWPLLLKYGDLDCLWRETMGNLPLRFEVLSYNAGGVEAAT